MKLCIKSSESWKSLDESAKEDLFNEVLFEAAEDNNLDYDADRSGVSFFFRSEDEDGEDSEFAFNMDNEELDNLLEDYFHRSNSKKEFIDRLSRYISMYV